MVRSRLAIMQFKKQRMVKEGRIIGELSAEEKKKRMEMGIWSYEPPEDKRRTVVRPIVDIMKSPKKSPKRQNNNTPRKVDQNKTPNKLDPLIDIKQHQQQQQQQIIEQQQKQQQNSQEAPGGLSQRHLVTEVNKSSANVPPLGSNVSDDVERGVPPADSVTMSDRSTVDGSITPTTPDRKSSGRPGSTRKLFTKVTATEHMTRNNDRSPSRSPNRPLSGRPPSVHGSPVNSGRKSAPINLNH